MIALRQEHLKEHGKENLKERVSTKQVMWLAVGLAFLSALIYLLMDLGALGVGDLQPEEGASIIIYVAAGSYVLGGLLILLRRRWLWVVGAIMNALVISFFTRMYLERPAILLSPGGLASKTVQILLELALIYLILNSILKGRR